MGNPLQVERNLGMIESNANGGEVIGYGTELYHEVQRLLCDWMGRDAGVQTSMVPQLIADILRVARGHTTQVARVAAHDGPVAA